MEGRLGVLAVFEGHLWNGPVATDLRQRSRSVEGLPQRHTRPRTPTSVKSGRRMTTRPLDSALRRRDGGGQGLLLARCGCWPPWEVFITNFVPTGVQCRNMPRPFPRPWNCKPGSNMPWLTGMSGGGIPPCLRWPPVPIPVRQPAWSFHSKRIYLNHEGLVHVYRLLACIRVVAVAVR